MFQPTEITTRTPLPLEALAQLTTPDRNDTVDLSHGKWTKLSEKDHTQGITAWTVGKLDLESNQDEGVIGGVMGIQFTRLLYLSLKLNRICSLEPMTRLFIPSLQVLILDSNQFSSIKSLRKVQLLNLKEISLSGNKIIDPECLAEMKWPKLQLVNLEWFYGNSTINDLSVLVKMESNSLTGLWIQNPERIISLPVLLALKRKNFKLLFHAFRENYNSIIRDMQRNSKPSSLILP